MAEDWPPKLTIETEPVLRLFTGENFYSSADAALREAVLNAIDAIGRRRANLPELNPQIEVVVDRNNQTLVISDNGVGMSKEALGKLFTKVGASAARLKDNANNSAVGEFGIGALSYFLVCDRYELQTYKEGHEPIGLMFSEQMLDGKTSGRGEGTGP